MRIWFIFVLLVSTGLVSCQSTRQKDSAIHLRLTLDLDHAFDLQDAIIDELADLALGKGDAEFADGLAIVGHELHRYLTDGGAPKDSNLTIALDSNSQGGGLYIQYLDEKQEQQEGKHQLSSVQTQKLYTFLNNWSASKK